MTYAIHLIHLVMLMINWLIIDQSGCQFIALAWFETDYKVPVQAELPMGMRHRLANFVLCFGNRAGSSPVKVIILSIDGETLLEFHRYNQSQTLQPISMATPLSPYTHVPPSLNFVSWLLIFTLTYYLLYIFV